MSNTIPSNPSQHEDDCLFCFLVILVITVSLLLHLMCLCATCQFYGRTTGYGTDCTNGNMWHMQDANICSLSLVIKAGKNGITRKVQVR